MKVYPSSYALPVGPTIDTNYNNQCFRFLKFKSYIPSTHPQDRFPELNKAVGAIGEERVRQLLEDQYAVDEILVEEPFKQDLGDDVQVSGRADFVIKSANRIIEVKTTKSASVRSNVINKGILPTSYLGQTLTYMTAFDVTEGQIIVQYMHFSKSLDKVGFIDRWFHVEIHDDGSITIDGIKYEHDLDHMLQFYNLSKQYLLSDELPPRPIKDTPCYRCPFEPICNSVNPPTNSDDFADEVQKLKPDYSKQFGPPKMPRHDIRLKKK